MVLKKSQNGMEGFEPHPIIMEATVNTGFALTVGYSMKQGTQELHGTVAELQTVLNELVSLCNHKLIFVLIPRCIRKYIPLKYWPREYPSDTNDRKLLNEGQLIIQDKIIFQQCVNRLVASMTLFLTASITMLR